MSYNNVELYKLDSKKKVRVWKAYLRPEADGTVSILIEHGQQGGKIQTKTRVVKSGKNKGKVNETSVEEQAALELGYLYQKQFDDGYVLDIADYKEPVSPVLAHKYKDKSHTIVWKKSDGSDLEPEDVNQASTKLNGIRCFVFADYTKKAREVRFESRTRKPFKRFTHIDTELCFQSGVIRRPIFDGELYHPEIPFEIICALVNSDEYITVTDPETGKEWSTYDIQFHCYDVIDQDNPEETFYERFVTRQWAKAPWHSVKLVESVPVYSEDEMIALAKEWIKLGFEGLMLRASNVPYDFGKRSASLLKYKVMEQAEFKIKRVYLAENDDSKVMFELYNHFNKDEPYNTFDCALKGNKEINLAYYQNKEQHQDQSWLTVDYQVLSAYKVPLFPVGITVRQGSVIDGTFVPEV